MLADFGEPKKSRIEDYANVLYEGIDFQHQNLLELGMDSGVMTGPIDGMNGDGSSGAVL